MRARSFCGPFTSHHAGRAEVRNVLSVKHDAPGEGIWRCWQRSISRAYRLVAHWLQSKEPGMSKKTRVSGILTAPAATARYTPIPNASLPRLAIATWGTWQTWMQKDRSTPRACWSWGGHDPAMNSQIKCCGSLRGIRRLLPGPLQDDSERKAASLMQSIFVCPNWLAASPQPCTIR